MTTDIVVSRDGQILAHIRRFGLTTSATLHRLFFDGVSRKAVERVTTRLIQHGQIVSYPLYHPTSYYRLTASIARRFGLDDDDTKPYGGQAILRAYGTLAFCCLGPKLRQKLTSEEFRQQFADCVSRQRNIPTYGYYIDDDGQTRRLGLILVDHGADAQRMVRKAWKAVHDRMTIRAFQTIFKHNAFVVAVVTGTPEKANTLEEALVDMKGSVLYRIHVVPELANMMGGSRDAECG